MGIFHLKWMKGNWECSPFPALFLLVFQVGTLELTPFLDCLDGETALQLLTGFLPVRVQTAWHPALSWLHVFDQEITFKLNFKNTVYQESIYLQRRQKKDWGSVSQGCKRCRICEASEPHADSSACAALLVGVERSRFPAFSFVRLLYSLSGNVGHEGHQSQLHSSHKTFHFMKSINSFFLFHSCGEKPILLWIPY